jgi:anti-anti-sigma factor
MAMQITEVQSNGVLILELNGRLDTLTAEAAKEKLLAIIGDQPVGLVVDCSGVKYVSSIGLRVLMVATKRVAALQGKFVLCALPHHLRMVFDLAGFSAVVPVLPTREEALAFLSGTAP